MGVFARACVALTALFSSAGCVGIPGHREALLTTAANETGALEEAYGQSVNSQILLNVLRSRDRWPRHYVTIKGLTSQPSYSTTAGGTLALLPFNNTNGFRQSNATISNQASTNEGFGIDPLDTATINRAILSPLPRAVFAHYWNSPWERDVLLFVMANSITRYAGALHDDPDAETPVQPPVAPSGLDNLDDASIALARAWREGIANEPPPRDTARPDPHCTRANAQQHVRVNDCWRPPLFNSAQDYLPRTIRPSAPDAPATPTNFDTSASYAESLGANSYRCKLTPVEFNADSSWTGPTLFERNANLAASDEQQTGRQQPCAFYQLVYRINEYSRKRGQDFVRLRAAPSQDPSCDHVADIAITPANSGILDSIVHAAALPNSSLRLRRSSTTNNTNHADRPTGPPEAQPLEVQTCRGNSDASATPLVIEILDDHVSPRSPAGGHRVVVDAYYLTLRSIDEMIYAMGNLLRAGDESPRIVCAPVDPQLPCRGAPLFAITEQAEGGPDNYAAAVRFRGSTYFAGPAVSAHNTPTDWHEGDRTATVLTLLSQLFELNSSPGSAAAGPARTLTQGSP